VNDIIGVADALADICYILCGTAHSYGVADVVRSLDSLLVYETHHAELPDPDSRANRTSGMQGRLGDYLEAERNNDPDILAASIRESIAVALLLYYTRFGRYLYAIGANAEASRYSGVNVAGVTLWAYLLCGALAGLAGLIETARLGSGNPTGGNGYELDVVTAVVVGGASLSGGEGRVSGTILGGLLIAVLRNGSNLLGVDPFDQNIYIGLLILAAVTFDQWLRRKR
jgi:ABC-type glucose/galactose transport system permease subunit